jgi:hypothetical protein
MSKNLNYKSSNNQLSINMISIFLLIYTMIDLIRLYELIPKVIGNGLYVILGSIGILYTLVRKGIKSELSIFSFLFFYTLFGSIGILFNNNMNLQELLWPLAFVGIAILILNYNINYKLAKTIYYLVAFLLVITIVFAGSVNNVSLTSSRNTISVMLLFYFSIFAISSVQNHIKIKIFPVLVGLIISFLAIGRSGIITFSILTFLFLFIDYDGKSYKLTNPIKVFTVLSFSILIFGLFYNLLDDYFMQTILNFKDQGLESVRTLIWDDYLTKTIGNIIYITFGTPISGTYLLNLFNDNLHNSFLMLHAKYGIFMLGLVLILIIKSFVYFTRTKNLIFLFLLIALVFRMQFDHTNFNAQLDIILFYLIFYPTYKKRENRRI